MIYFFHHYELPVILQQAHTQDLLMRNQEGGGPPLIVAYEQGGPGAIAVNRRIIRNRDGTVNNNNNNNVNNNNGANINVNRRMTGFNFGPFRFRLGVVLTTHQRNDAGGNPQLPDSPPQHNHGHSHGHSHGHQHMHVHQHGHQHLHTHSHGHSHSREDVQPQNDNVESTNTEITRPDEESPTQEEQISESTSPSNEPDHILAGSTDDIHPNSNVLNLSKDLSIPTKAGKNVTLNDDLLTDNSKTVNGFKDCNITDTPPLGSGGSNELTVVESGDNISKKKLDNCDTSRPSSVKKYLDNISNDHTSQNSGETSQSSSHDGDRVINDGTLDEITNDLRQISSALKSTLPVNDNVTKSDP